MLITAKHADRLGIALQKEGVIGCTLCGKLSCGKLSLRELAYLVHRINQECDLSEELLEEEHPDDVAFFDSLTDRIEQAAFKNTTYE